MSFLHLLHFAGFCQLGFYTADYQPAGPADQLGFSLPSIQQLPCRFVHLREQ
jgi:hypothetical protein